MSLLYELYQGEIFPAQNIVPSDPDYRRLVHAVQEERQRLEETLTESEKAQMERLADLMLQESSQYAYENFAHGFRLGLLLMGDAASGAS